MSDILDPQGLEPNEALQDTDIQGVYQPTSGGIRRNKQATLATLKLFFRKLTTFTPNNIVEADGTGNLRTTSIATSAVSQSIADTNTNTNELADKVNQGVKTTDTPVFADATIASHAIDAELSTLNNRVNQDVRTTATPTFADVNITGLTGTVENRIETNTADISTLDGRVDGNDSDIATLDGRVDGNDTDITNLQTKTPQSYKTTDDVEFNKVSTDTISEKTAGAGVRFNHQVKYEFYYFRDSNPTSNEIYDDLSAVLPNVGDYISLEGQTFSGSGTNRSKAISMERITTSRIEIYFLKNDGTIFIIVALDGTSSFQVSQLEIMGNFDVIN